MDDIDPMKDPASESDLLGLDDIPSSANPLSIAIQRASRLLRADLHRLLEAHGNLSLVDFRLLRQLNRVEVATQKELKHSVQMEQAQVSRSLASLEKRQMVTSCTYPMDRRVRLFSIRPKGRDAFEAVRPKVVEHNATLTAFLSGTEQSRLLDELHEIVRRSAASARKAASGNKIYDNTKKIKKTR